MSNIFPIAAQDQSVYYLSTIFGAVGNVLPLSSTGGSLMLGSLYYVLNGMALTVGVLIIVYTTVVGILATAHEGEFMGKKWSGLWVPIRMVMGVVAVFPHTSGYSTIQVIIMWVILQGVGAADKLWNTALNYIDIAGSPYAGIKLDTTGIQSTMTNLFSSAVCQASVLSTANYSDTYTGSDGSAIPLYYCSPQNTNNTCTISNFPTIPTGTSGTQTYQLGLNGSCGTLTFGGNCNSSATDVPSQVACAATQAQQTALTQIMPNIAALAQAFVVADHDYLQFANGTPPFTQTNTITNGASSIARPVATPNVSIPGWIQNYCNAQSPPVDPCCYNETMTTIQTVNYGFGSQTQSPVTTTQTCSAANTSLYSPFNSYGNSVDYFNTSTNAAQKIYPTALASLTNGTDVINTFVTEYTSQIQNAVGTVLTNAAAGTPISNEYAEEMNYGWILAGGYYYKIAQMNSNNLTNSVPQFSITQPQTSGSNVAAPMNNRNNYSAASDFLTAVQNAANAANGNQGPTQSLPTEAGKITNSVNTASSSLLATFIANMNGCHDVASCAGNAPVNPLASISLFGYQLMVAAQTLFAVLVLAYATLVAVTAINPTALGSGLTLSPIGEMIKSIGGFLSPLFVALIGGMYSLGALLGIYLPMIPFILYTVAAIGWLIGVIEAMTAGPLIALGILSPGGQHEILGRAEPALMMLFNLFLRPSLMVFGMMASMLLSVVVITLINSAFLAVTSSIISAPGLFEELLFISVYTSLVITAFNKSFSLIYYLPEKVATWIGGHAAGYGEAEAAGATKSAVEHGAGAAVGGAKESGASVGAGVNAILTKDKKDANAEREKGSNIRGGSSS